MTTTTGSTLKRAQKKASTDQPKLEQQQKMIKPFDQPQEEDDTDKAVVVNFVVPDQFSDFEDEEEADKQL